MGPLGGHPRCLLAKRGALRIGEDLDVSSPAVDVFSFQRRALGDHVVLTGVSRTFATFNLLANRSMLLYYCSKRLVPQLRMIFMPMNQDPTWPRDFLVDTPPAFMVGTR